MNVILQQWGINKNYMENINITPNFSLHEFIEASPNNDKEFKRIAWDNIGELNVVNAKKIINLTQAKRDYINRMFRADNGGKEIGLKITSGFRPLAWEKIKKRSGLSRHTQSDAIDFQPLNCSPELAVKIIQHLYDIDSDKVTGHQGGFAIKKPTIIGGSIRLVGFAHYDLRPGQPARWFY